MEIADRIIGYLKETYRPDAIIVYGSFSDGSANKSSDFDALVIAGHRKEHDSSVIDGTILDVFIYPVDTFLSEYNPEEFVQVWDGTIILDKNSVAEHLQKRVLEYIELIPQKTDAEILQELDWCEKMVSRTLREDTEGYYRWHWVLFDSLEIYYDIKHLHYYGPKKALRQMELSDTEAFRLYSRALKELDRKFLSEWVGYLRTMFTAS